MRPQDRKPRNSVVLDRCYVAKGKIIMREGEPGTHAYLIQSGKVEVYSDTGGARVSLGVLEPGEIFGEMALFNGDRRTASVEALEPCNLIKITQQSLEDKLKHSDPTIRAIVCMAFRRLSGGNRLIAKGAAD